MAAIFIRVLALLFSSDAACLHYFLALDISLDQLKLNKITTQVDSTKLYFLSKRC